MASRSRKSRDISCDLAEKAKRENTELVSSLLSSLYSSLLFTNRSEEWPNDADYNSNGDGDDGCTCHCNGHTKRLCTDVHFQGNEQILGYCEEEWKSQRKRHVRSRAVIRRISAANGGKIQIGSLNSRTSISHRKVSKHHQKKENKMENISKRKENISRKLLKLGLRRRNEDTSTAIEKANESYWLGNKFAISGESMCFGTKTWDFASLQYRDISPNDYELLLELDDNIQPKIVPNKVLEKIETKTVPVWMKEENYVCCICFEVLNEDMKELPKCGHCFHVSCIDTWLGTASNACPIDQQKVTF